MMLMQGNTWSGSILTERDERSNREQQRPELVHPSVCVSNQPEFTRRKNYSQPEVPEFIGAQARNLIAASDFLRDAIAQTITCYSFDFLGNSDSDALEFQLLGKDSKLITFSDKEYYGSGVFIAIPKSSSLRNISMLLSVHCLEEAINYRKHVLDRG